MFVEEKTLRPSFAIPLSQQKEDQTFVKDLLKRDIREALQESAELHFLP